MTYLFHKGSQVKFLKKFLFVAQATEIVSPLRYTFNVINQIPDNLSV